MAVIGEIVIGISTKLDGLKKGVDEANGKVRGLTKELRQSVRMLKQFMGAFGVNSLVSKFTDFVGKTNRSILELGEESRKTGKSIEELTNGALTAFDVTQVEAAAKAYDSLASSWERLAQQGAVKLAPVLRDVAEFMEHGFLEAPTEVQGQIDFFEKNNADVAKKLEDFIAKLEEQTATSGLSESQKKQRELDGLLSGGPEGTAAQDKAEKLLGLLQQQEMDKISEEMVAEAEETFQKVQAIIDDINARDLEDRLKREEEARSEQLEKEVQAFQKILDFSDDLTESLKTPQQKFDDFAAKLQEAFDAGQITEDQFRGGFLREQSKLEGDPKLAGTALSGSQDALSAIALARRGSTTDKIPSQQLRVLQSIENKVGQPVFETLETFSFL